MAKIGRLTRSLIEQVKSKGRNSRTFSHLFSVKIAKLEGLPADTSVFGIVVPAKVFKQAVTRNKVKRQIKASLNILKNNLKPGYGVIFFCQAKVKDAKQPELLKELNNTLYDILTI